MMLTCGTRMQSGQFREAFLDAESALDLLRTSPPPISGGYWRVDSRYPRVLHRIGAGRQCGAQAAQDLY